MIAIDTNIVVRLLTHDDEVQYKKTYKLFNEHDVFIADTVILETEWVLRFAYNFDTRQIADALTRLFGLPNVHISHPSLLAQTIAWHLQGLDFGDAFHLANSQQCKTFFTFDKKMINAAKNIDACEVLAP
jgi:predicted nucleic-acid-binding protein